MHNVHYVVSGAAEPNLWPRAPPFLASVPSLHPPHRPTNPTRPASSTTLHPPQGLLDREIGAGCSALDPLSSRLTFDQVKTSVSPAPTSTHSAPSCPSSGPGSIRFGPALRANAGRAGALGGPTCAQIVGADAYMRTHPPKPRRGRPWSTTATRVNCALPHKSCVQRSLTHLEVGVRRPPLQVTDDHLGWFQHPVEAFGFRVSVLGNEISADDLGTCWTRRWKVPRWEHKRATRP